MSKQGVNNGKTLSGVLMQHWTHTPTEEENEGQPYLFQIQLHIVGRFLYCQW